MAEELLYLNGRFMPLSRGRIPVEDRGFQLGDGVYEVIKVMNGRLVWLEDHLERLERSLNAVRLTQTQAVQELGEVLPRLVEASGVDHGSVYLQVTRGPAPREFVFPQSARPTVLAYVRAAEPPTMQEILAGIVLHPVEDLRWARCDIKSTNLLAAVLAKEEALEAGAHEALFLGPGGVVREGGSSNVFAVLEGVIRTHPLSNRILAGITRLHALRLARRDGLPVEEREFTLADITTAAPADCEVFTASTTKDLRPVLKVGDHVIGDGRPGRVTLTLLDAFRREQAQAVGLPAPPALSWPDVR